MKKILLSINVLLLFTWMSSCGIRTHLSQTEMKWINVYKVGDTLIFKSDLGEFDTTIIIKKEIFYPEYNPIESDGRYLPQWGVVWYKNKQLIYHPEGFRMISLVKELPHSKTSLSIDYLYSKVLYLNITNDSIRHVEINKVFRFDTYDPRAKPGQPKVIFWHEDFGIVKYITHSGVIWVRVNLPKSIQVN